MKAARTLAAIVRILIGAYFIWIWVQNIQKGFYTPAGYEGLLTRVFPQSHNPLTWYAAFITNFVLPHKAIFAAGQFVFELAIGIALVVGFLTPAVAMATAIWVVNLFLATYGAETLWTYIALFAGMLFCAFTRAGRALGLDALIARHLGEPRVPLW